MQYDDLISNLEVLHDRRAKGLYNSIPFSKVTINNNKHDLFTSYGKLNKAGITPSGYTLITAASGVGKTKFAKWMYMYYPIAWCLDQQRFSNKDNFDVRVHYFTVEEDQEEFYLNVARHVAFTYAKKVLDLSEVRAFGNSKADPDILKVLKDIKPYVKMYMDKIILHPYVTNIEKIQEIMISYFNNNGTHKKGVGYVPNNPNQINIIIVDHINNLTGEQSGYNTIRKFSKEIVLNIFKKRFKAHCVLVQQQAMSADESVYNFSAERVLAKLKPTHNGLNTCKETYQDALDVIGLWSPEKYDISEYKGFDIDSYLTTDRRFREISIMKSRYNGTEGMKFLFDMYKSDYFKQLQVNKSNK